VVFPIEKSIAGTALGDTQLWITDGTVAGSRILVDSLSGKAASLVCAPDGDAAFLITQPTGSPRNTVSKHLLWRSDGTAQGTVSLAEFRDITGPLEQPTIAVVSGAAFWGGTKADDLKHHAVLWQADTKTQDVKLAHDGRDGTVGRVGWIDTMTLSDGTTRLIVASATRRGFSTTNPSLLMSLGGGNGDGIEVLMGSHLFDFYAPAFQDAQLLGAQAFIRPPQDGASPTGDAFLFTVLGKEVFRSDGTKDGTSLLPIRPELWVPPTYGSKKLFYSGPPAGANEHRLRVLPLGGAAEDIVDLGPPILVPSWNLPSYAHDGDQLIYITKDSTLWRSDGTAANTRAVTILPPRTSPNNAWPADIRLRVQKIVTVGAQRLILIHAYDPATSMGQSYLLGMNATDTSASDVFTGSAVDMEVVGDWALFFSAGSPWAVDGTLAGTVNLAPAFGPLNDGQYIRYLTSLPGNRALLLLKETQSLNVRIDKALWISDGTLAGTFELLKINTLIQKGDVVSWDDKLSLLVIAGVLWRTDGTVSGTQRLTPPGLRVHEVSATTAGAIYFTAEDTEHGVELWHTTARAAPTLVKDIAPGPADSAPQHFKVIGDYLYFSATTKAAGREPYVLDTRDQEMQMIGDIRPGPRSNFTGFNGSIVFSADHSLYGHELWQLPAPGSLTP